MLEIPSKNLYDEFVTMGNCSYSYDEIITTLQDAHALNEQLDLTVNNAWCLFESKIGTLDYIDQSDDQRKKAGILAGVINECFGIDLKAAIKGKELVPVRRLQTQMKKTKKHIERINQTINSLL